MPGPRVNPSAPPAFDPLAPEPIVWREGAVAPFDTKEADQAFGDRVADSWRLNWLGQYAAQIREEGAAFQQATVGFDGLEHVPQGYEYYASSFGNATTQEEVDTIQHEIDGNIAARRRRMNLTFGQALGADLTAGLIDPTNYIPGFGVAGKGTLKGAALGGVSLGVLGAAQSTAAAAMDPTATWREAAWGAGTSAVLGVGIGGLAGRFGRPRSAALSPVVRSRLPLPAGAAEVTSGFGWRTHPVTGKRTFHKGVDLAYPEGTPLKAQADATVRVVTTKLGGHEVHLDYGGGIVVKMLHLRDVTLHDGDRVTAGTVFGHVGRTGRVTGPHLHYQVTKDGQAVDPFGMVKVGGIPRDPGAMADAMAGVAVPESFEHMGQDVTVEVRPTEDGQAATIRHPRMDAIVDDVVREVGEDLGQSSDGDLIADYLKRGGPITRIRRGRRSLPKAGAARVSDEEAGFDVTMVDPERAIQVADRIDRRIAAILEHPRINLDATAPDDFLRRVRPDDPNLELPRHARPKGWDDELPTWRIMVDELAQRSETLRDHATAYSERLDPETGRLRGSPLVAEAEAHVRSQARRELSDADLELARQKRAETRPLRDDGELPDVDPRVRPLSAAERRAGRTVLADTFEDVEGPLPRHVTTRLEVDPHAIAEGWRTRAYAGEKLPGGQAIDVGALGSHADYFNFVVARALKLDELGASGAAADLIEKANAAALAALKDGSAPFVPAGGWLKRLAISFTPMEQMHRLAPDKAEIQRAMYRLAGDGGVMLVANKAGLPTVEGGSVLMRRDQWIGRIYGFTDAVHRAWLKAIGRDSTRGRTGTLASIMGNRLLKRGEAGLKAFRIEVGRAIVGFDDVSAEAHEAASKWHELMGLVEGEARSVGMFTEAGKAIKAAEATEVRIANLEAKISELKERGFDPDRIAPLEALVESHKAEAVAYRDVADRPITHKGEPGHFSRIWHKGRLTEDPEGATDMLERAYKREGHPDPRAAAQGAYELLVAQPEAELMVPGTPGFLKVRSIPASNKEAWDYIVQDPETVGYVYLRRMGAAIEMSRMFGDSFALGEIDRLTVDLVTRDVPREKIAKAVQLFEDQRDRIVGGFHGSDPLSFSNRSVKAISNATQIELMGGSPRSQMSDIASIILTQGVGVRRLVTGDTERDAGILGALVAHIGGEFDKFHPAGPLEKAEAAEILTSRLTAQLIESDDALLATRQTKAEEMLNAFVPRFHIASLLTPLTVWLKELTTLASASNLVRDAKLVAEGKASDALLARLAQIGLSAETAVKIAGMPIELGKSGLYLLNTPAWLEKEGGAELAQAFRAAVYNEIRRTVITPGPLDKPAVADGVIHTDSLLGKALGKGSQKGAHDAKLVVLLETQAELRGALAKVHDYPDGHPEKQELIDKLTAVAGEITVMQRGSGRAGRIEAPFMQLPFRLKSFNISAGGKRLHGLLTGSDRRRVSGMLSLLAAGYIGWRWKMQAAGIDPDKRPLGQHLWGAIDNSSLTAWLGDTAKSIDTLIQTNALPGPDNRPGGWDEGGAVMPAVAMFERLYRPFVAPDDSAEAHAIRKAIPLQNAVWLDHIMDVLEDRFSAGGGGPAPRALPEVPRPSVGNGIDDGVLPPAPPVPRPGVEPILLDGKLSIPGVNALFARQKKEGAPRNATEDVGILEDLDGLLALYRQPDMQRKLLKRARKRDHPKGRRKAGQYGTRYVRVPG